MGFSVNTNQGALIALQNLNATNRQLNVVQGRINTGLKVSGAKDDASIFAIAQTQRAELGGLAAVKGSLSKAIGAVDVALAGAEAISDLLIQMKEKAVAAKDPGQDATSRGLLNNDYQQLLEQIETISDNAEFNGRNSIKSSAPDDIVAIVNADASSTVVIPGLNLGIFNLGLYETSINNLVNATTALGAIDTAIGSVNDGLSVFGAGAKRLEIVSAFVEKLADAIEVGIGNLVDADLARESASLQSLGVKQQLGLQALSIANQSPGSILSLFG